MELAREDARTAGAVEDPKAVMPRVVLVARNDDIAALVQQCADGTLPFSGPDSLCAKVHAMGFNTTSLYGAVMACRASK